MSDQPKIVFRTDWFEIEEEFFDHIPHLGKKPYYRLKSPDAIVVFAITREKEIVLVKQFRPAIRETTLELPAGGVHPNEMPLDAARRELLEETGYSGENFESLASGHVMMDRIAGKLYGFFARDVEKTRDPQNHEGIEVVTLPLKTFKKQVLDGKFEQFGGLGLVLLADWKWKIFND